MDGQKTTVRKIAQLMVREHWNTTPMRNHATVCTMAGKNKADLELPREEVCTPKSQVHMWLCYETGFASKLTGQKAIQMLLLGIVGLGCIIVISGGIHHRVLHHHGKK